MTRRLPAASFLDEAQKCRGVARTLGGSTREAALLLNVATAFEELHAAKQAKPQRDTSVLPPERMGAMDQAIWLDFKRECMAKAGAATLPDVRVMAAELRSELLLFQAGGRGGVQRVAGTR